MKRFIFSLGILCLYCICALSQEWISLNGTQQKDAVSMEVLQSDDLGYKVQIEINGLYDQIVQNEKGTFHFLSVNKVGQLVSIGSPALPCINQIIAIPPGATMSVSVDNEKWKDIEMGTIYPFQDSEPVKEGRRAFYVNETVYKKPFLPSILNVGKEDVWHGVRHAGVSVCPFKYYPQENRLSVLQSFTLNVDFKGQRATPVKRADSRFGLFDNTVYEEEDLASAPRSSNDDNYDYLIILGNLPQITNNLVFSEKLRQFRIWKALKGFKTKVANATTIGNSTSSIRNYIIQEKSKGVSYVLIVGDSGDIPLAVTPNYSNNGDFCSNGAVKGDYWYGCVNGNIKADIPIGRFSTSSIADFENMVNKTIKYESYPNFFNNALLIAHSMGAPYPLSYQGCCETIRYAPYTEPMTFGIAYGADILYGGNNATNQYVVNQINEGYNIVNYRGHAGTDCWGYAQWGTPVWNEAGECFTSSEINNMDSTTCSVFFCIACNTGNIDSPTNCMLETFTRSNHGAAAFIGSTMSVNTYANHDYNILLFHEMLNDSVYHLGDVNIKAHINNIIINEGNDSTAANNALSYVCGGDPALELWTASPQQLSCDVTIANGYITINTGLLGNYSVNIVSVDGELLNSIPCSTTTCTFQIPADKFLFSINKHNYVPYVLYYDRVTDEIKDISFTFNAYFEASPIIINSYETDVVVKSGNKLKIKNGNGGVLIDSIFECEKGAVLEIE